MNSSNIISEIKKKLENFSLLEASENHSDELCIKVRPQDFEKTCFALHKILHSPVMMLFAQDERERSKKFVMNCVFLGLKHKKWVFVKIDIPEENPSFETLAKSIYSANLFEREIKEMFGIEPRGNPDLRRLNLHEEVWSEGNYPLRKDFKKETNGNKGEYKFYKVEGEGMFEIPVGPVHAGIIGPGHFRFSVAGEPIINLETRLGFTHRGVEKLFEVKSHLEGVRLSECVSGDASFAHSMAFIYAIEKISGIVVSQKTAYLRGIVLELERMYNHVNDIGGIAIDVGFSFPAAFASIIKEAILELNEKLTGNRYLRKINVAGGILMDMDEDKKIILLDSIKKIMMDFKELIQILNSSVSFMDRVDNTGVLRRKTAEDLGVIGLAGRASGIPMDLRKYFSDIYKEAKFNMITEVKGDVLARLKVRILEFEESARLIEEFTGKLIPGEKNYSEFCIKC